MRNIVGEPVRGNNFFLVKSQVSTAWTKVSKGSVITSAPRRGGKTSLMSYMEDHPKYGWHPIMINAESHRSPAHFVASLITAVKQKLEVKEAFWKKMRFYNKVKRFSGRVKKIDVKVIALELADQMGDEWKLDGLELLSALSDIDEQVLIIIDEFPIFIDRLSREENGLVVVEDMLRWLRSIRQDLSGHEKAVRFMFGGSIGLDAVLGKLGLSDTVNDMDVMYLEGLDADTASDFLQELSKGESLPLPEISIERILDRLGVFVPFQLQLLFSRLSDRCKRNGFEVTPEIVDEEYAKLLKPPCKKYFAHWDERLDKILERNPAEAARYVLALVAQSPGGIGKDVFYAAIKDKLPDASRRDLTSLTDLLIHDGYIAEKDEEETDRIKLYFSSSLLRDWWKRWYGDDLGHGGN